MLDISAWISCLVPSDLNALKIHLILVKGSLNKKCFDLWRVSGSITIESFENVKHASEGVLFLVKLQPDIL